jgi:YD repeat-containing protein
VESSWEYAPASGFPKSQTISGVTTTFGTDAFGNVSQITNANGKMTRVWHEYGTVTRVESPAYTVQRRLNLDGTLEYETRGVGTAQEQTTRFYYDDLFRLTHVGLPQPINGRHAIVTTYDPAGRWMKVERGASFTKTIFDAFGRAVETLNSKDVRTTRRYDAESRVVFESYPFTGENEIGTRFDYDGLGRLTKRTNPDTSFSTVSYGAGQTTYADENGNESTDVWLAFGHPDDARVTQHVDAHGKAWQYTYNVSGDVAELLGPGGLTRAFEYNEKNRLWRETHPESGTTEYDYDGVGNVTKKTDALKQAVIYEYDDANRLKKITAGGEITEIAYQAGSDNRASARVGNVRMTYLYDGAGRPSGQQAVINGRLLETKYVFDANDNLQGIIYPSMRRVEYQFDSENRITSIVDKFSGTTYASGFAYHPSGAFADYNVGNGTGFHFTYHPTRYWLTDLRGGPLGLAYNSHDNVGNVLAIDDARGSTPWRQTFEYDKLNRLTKATGAYGIVPYSYDDHGSMLTGGGASFTVDPATLRMTHRNGASFSYFNNGNLQSGPFGSYTYTGQHQIATATVNGAVTSCAYDADNWRALKVEPTGETTLYIRGVGGQLLSEWTTTPGTEPTKRDYIYAGSRLIATVSR